MLSLDAELDTFPEPVRPEDAVPETFALETLGDVDEPDTLGEVRLELEEETPDEDALRVDL